MISTAAVIHRSLAAATLIIGVMSAAAVSAADLGAPTLSPPLAGRDYLDTGQLLKAGMRLEGDPDVIIEPHLGLGHAKREWGVRTGFDNVTHSIHARAGGEIQLFRLVSLSASAKLPVYSVESSDPLIAGTASPSGSRRYGYEILRPVDKVSWVGEMGLRLGDRLDLSVFYDRNRFDLFPGAGENFRQEDRFGTRLIFRFR